MSIEDLSAAVTCRVILPGETGYDLERRVWNADVDRRPAAIVKCRDADDVSQALTWAVGHGFEITVRGGGHNLAGTSVIDGAVLLDTGPMKDVLFDTEAGTVTVGAGCRWGDVDRPAADLGVAVPAGVVSHTGVAGLTLGGGAGYLSRMYGMTVDHLVAATVVVADGRILRVSETEHPDLFWALRGAGHNYGVATSFTFRYVPLPGEATVRIALFATDDRAKVLRFFRDWSVTAPDNVSTYARLYKCPAYWSQVPTAHRETEILSVATVFYGDPAEEEAVTAPMFAQAEPVYRSLRTIPHVTLQHATDDEFRYGVGHYWKHVFLEALSDDVIDLAIDWADRYPGRSLQAHANIAHQVMCPFEVIGGGGAMARRDREATAAGSHFMPFSANIGADFEFAEEKPPLLDWARGFADALAPHQGGTYVNFASVQGDADAARAVYGDKYDRLVAVKRAYDPRNVFHRGLVDLAPEGAA
ncbi:FAD/FMN-containing dehydrogenase [Actinocorallia herbida]|uniref:FAD/FMN-containing dehydrogenase n=1 Tax=Actinocorallia herbida TaxID=58109 RepID=A0A3N1D0D9_9ACTN|nr:FAD-binding oxidoreductase [Actinocorallia herbida]ROO86993.1 FAD/FMN-containing dehydrogenase [Actinocorallia herbida]